MLTQPANLRSSVTLVRCLQHGCRIGLSVLGLVTAGCQRVESDTGISQQQVGFGGGAAGGALGAAAAGASAPWIVGGAHRRRPRHGDRHARQSGSGRRAAERRKLR